MQVQWWGYHKVVGMIKPCHMQKNLELFTVTGRRGNNNLWRPQEPPVWNHRRHDVTKYTDCLDQIKREMNRQGSKSSKVAISRYSRVRGQLIVDRGRHHLGRHPPGHTPHPRAYTPTPPPLCRHLLPQADIPLPPRQTCPLGRYPLPPETATAADGTHPTGMHSCLVDSVTFYYQNQVFEIAAEYAALLK